MSRMGMEVTTETKEAAAEAREEIPTSRVAEQPCNIVVVLLPPFMIGMIIFREFFLVYLHVPLSLNEYFVGSIPYHCDLLY